MSNIIYEPVFVSVDRAGGFYDMEAWLRDTCIPDVRPLYNVFLEQRTPQLKGASVVAARLPGGHSFYKLLLLQGGVVSTFTAVGRVEPTTANDFKQLIETVL